MSRTTGSIPLDVTAITALAIGGLATYAAISGSREAMVMVALLVPIVALFLIVHIRVGFSPWLLRGLLLWMLLEITCRFVGVAWWTPTDGRSRLLGALWIAKPAITIGSIVHFFGLMMLTWFFCQALAGQGRGQAGSRASIGILATACCAAIGSVVAVGALLRLLADLVPRLGIVAPPGSVDLQLIALLAVISAAILVRLRLLPG